MDRIRLVVAIACAAAVAGCTGSPYEATVTGTVTLDGKPIGPGVVQFVPVGRGHNPATGAIAVDGSYELRTSNAAGLAAGAYDVTVAIYDQPKLAPGERAPPGSAPLRTPEKYVSADTTDLQFEVQAGANTIDVPLVSDGR